LTALRCARLKCEVGASSITWRLPSAGRHLCGRCSDDSVVTRAVALSAHTRAAPSVAAVHRTKPASVDVPTQTPAACVRGRARQTAPPLCQMMHLQSGADQQELGLAPRHCFSWGNHGIFAGACDRIVSCQKRHTATCACGVGDRLVAHEPARHDSDAVRGQMTDAGLSRVCNWFRV
jgi:hypothetical protein